MTFPSFTVAAFSRLASSWKPSRAIGVEALDEIGGVEHALVLAAAAD
jgi:hypothetical protein